METKFKKAVLKDQKHMLEETAPSESLKLVMADRLKPG